MATVVRGPLDFSRREPPRSHPAPHPYRNQAALTAPAVVDLPLSSGRSFPQLVQNKPGKGWINPNTSAGVPLPLFPRPKPPTLEPHAFQGLPPQVVALQVQPFALTAPIDSFAPPQTVESLPFIRLLYQNADTTQSSFAVNKPVVVQLALTGVSATGQAGTVASAITYGASGNAATGAVGNIAAGSDFSAAVTGNAATGNVGTVASAVTYGVTGNQASGQVGSVVAAVTFGATGNQASGAVGTVASAVAPALTGNQAAGDVGNVLVAGDVIRSVSGVQASGQVGTVSQYIPPVFIGGDADEPKKQKFRNEREEIRKSILRAINGPEEVREVVERVVAATKDPNVEIEDLRRDYEAAKAEIARLEEEDILMLL